MRWNVLLACGAVAAFLLGGRLAGAPPSYDGLVEELGRRQRYLEADVAKVERAAKDVDEMRRLRATGKFVLNEEERRMEKQGRVDFHIFLERIRNDTLEVLEIYDRVLNKQDYVDPLERKFGKALHQVVEVGWDELPLEDVLGEISGAYGVPIHIQGEIDYRKTMSLAGEMSLLSILLYIENLYDARLVVKGDDLWFIRVGKEGEPDLLGDD